MSLVLMKNYKNKNHVTSERNKRVQDFLKEKQTSNKAGRVSLKTLSFCMVSGLIFSGAFYLSQVNGIAIKGFDARDVQKKLVVLQKENEKLKIQEAELSSMNGIENSMGDLNLVNSTNVSYVEINSPVAMK